MSDGPSAASSSSSAPPRSMMMPPIRNNTATASRTGVVGSRRSNEPSVTASTTWNTNADDTPTHTAQGRRNLVVSTSDATIVLSGSSARKTVPNATKKAAIMGGSSRVELLNARGVTRMAVQHVRQVGVQQFAVAHHEPAIDDGVPRAHRTAP